MRVNHPEPGELHFKLKITKKGFDNLVQTEHWGDLPHNTSTIMYFGLKEPNSDAKSFSSLSSRSLYDELSYASVSNRFSEVKEKRAFYHKLEKAKANNEKAFFQIDNTFYLANSTGWIKLHSDKDLVSINDTQIIPANQLNATISRKNIIGMTPLEPTMVAQFAVHTR